MIASITVIFGFDVNKSILTAFLSSTLGAGGATLLGKTVVTNLVKLISGAGTLVGGAISSATAGVITAALGEAYIGIMELVFKGEMSIDDLSTDNDDQRSLHLKYDDAIAFHYLKYAYDPYDSMYWRNTRDRFFHLTDEDRKRKRQEFESNYQELIMKIKSI